jgi:hypothetical protein
LYGGRGTNHLYGGTGVGAAGTPGDTYHLTGGSNQDYIHIAVGDSKFQLAGHVPTGFDRVYGFDKSLDKIDLPSAAIMGSTGFVNVPENKDIGIFGGHRISNGVVTLKTDTGATIVIDTLTEVKQAYAYMLLNCTSTQLNKAAVLHVNYQGSHDIVFESHGSASNTTTVDLVGTNITNLNGIIV